MVEEKNVFRLNRDKIRTMKKDLAKAEQGETEEAQEKFLDETLIEGEYETAEIESTEEILPPDPSQRN